MYRQEKRPQHLGVLEVAINDSQTEHNMLVPLGSKIEDDQKIKDMIGDYEHSVASMYNNQVQENAALKMFYQELLSVKPAMKIR